MQIIIPITIDNTALEASNVPEDDYAEWDSGTTYAEDDFVIVIGTTHKVYQSVQGSNTNRNPVNDDGTWWTEISATNRWKAFDEVIGEQVSQSESITYSIRCPSDNTGIPVTGIAFFNTEADTVRVQIFDGSDVEVYDETVSAVASTTVDGWFDYWYGAFDEASEQLFLDQPSVQDLPGYEGYRIDLTLTRTGGTAKAGQIVLGKLYALGRTVKPGTSVSAQDFSTKEQDATFGKATLLRRGFAKEVEFAFVFPTEGAQRIDTLITSVRATPIVWLAGVNTSKFATTVYGWWEDYSLNLEGTNSPARITVQGLV